jgi:hypothetical protein
MNSTDSGIFSLASVGSYLDALSSITDEISLRDRSNLIFLDKCLHGQWGLGQNVILNWCPEPGGVSVLVIPHYAVADHSISSPMATESGRTRPSEDFFKSLLSRKRRLTPPQMDKVARLLDISKTFIPLRDDLPESLAQQQIVENMVKRYSISYVENRAVALFDIVGFSLLSPFEQMSQLNSLSYSLNSAQSKLFSKEIDVNFARSTTGDGFYIWNRDLSLEANINLYHFMHLVLADNAIASEKAAHSTVPRLRACFHLGSCYEFHQSEGLNPTIYNYIVGDVTVELARIIDSALPGQVLVGDFEATLRSGKDETAPPLELDSIDFILNARESLDRLEGLELSGDRIDSIKCYLTGSRQPNGEYAIRRIEVNDKHGMSRRVYNAKINIYRTNASPILLGIEDQLLDSTSQLRTTSEQLTPSMRA